MFAQGQRYCNAWIFRQNSLGLRLYARSRRFAI